MKGNIGNAFVVRDSQAHISQALFKEPRKGDQNTKR